MSQDDWRRGQVPQVPPHFRDRVPPAEQPPWGQQQYPQQPPYGQQYAPTYPGPPQHQAPKRKRHRARNVLIGLGAVVVVIIAISVAAGAGKSKLAATSHAATEAKASPKAVTARSYKSTRSLLAAMRANGAPCTGAYFIASSVTGTVGKLAECSGASNGDTALAVFTGHAAALTYAHHMITLSQGNGGTPAAVVVGPDWAVNTTPAFARKVVKAIGGKVVSGSAAAAGNSQVPPPAATTAPAPAPASQVVATYSGSGIQNTPQFTVTSTWKLEYTYDCSSFGSSGNFIVEEDGGNDFGGASVNELGAGGSSSTYAYNDAGTHYLSINSECSWTVKIIDEN